MKVYILSRWTVSEHWVVDGIFTTKEKADAYQQRHPPGRFEEYQTSEQEADPE